MKKVIISFVIFSLILLGIVGVLASCNYDIIDTNYSFDYAYISYGDGTVEKVKIKSWRDYEDGEQIQITSTDGDVYLVNSYNCVLIKEN